MDLREQIVRALRKVATRPEACADAVMAVVQPALDTKDARIAELEARVDRFKKQRAGWSGISDLRDEANEYEATIDRVKALLPNMAAIADAAEAKGHLRPYSIEVMRGWITALRAALDQPGDQTMGT